VFFKAKTETFPVRWFFLALTQHIPPKACQYIRRYGLYASRSKGKWPDKPQVLRLALICVALLFLFPQLAAVLPGLLTK
jgi:hypothetical protein